MARMQSSSLPWAQVLYLLISPIARHEFVLQRILSVHSRQISDVRSRPGSSHLSLVDERAFRSDGPTYVATLVTVWNNHPLKCTIIGGRRVIANPSRPCRKKDKGHTCLH